MSYFAYCLVEKRNNYLKRVDNISFYISQSTFPFSDLKADLGSFQMIDHFGVENAMDEEDFCMLIANRSMGSIMFGA